MRLIHALRSHASRAERSVFAVVVVGTATLIAATGVNPALSDVRAARAAGSEVVLAESAPSLKFDTVTLANGLQVYLREDHRTPIVAVNVHYRVGSKDEEPGKNGFAHLFEHMMFQGSKHVPEDTYFKMLERVGATDINGTTNTDRTNYYETVPSNQLELALWLESDRMGFLLDHVTAASFAGQRDVVKNERRQNYENTPYGMVSEFYMRQALYPANHPYQRSTIGTPADLDAASLDDVKAFFRTYYVPNNASLALVGDFSKAAALTLVERYFGPIVRGAEVVRRPTPAVALTTQTVLTVESGAVLPRLQFMWPTPALMADGDADLDFAAHLLANGKSSRLYKLLVHDAQIAQDVSAAQVSAHLGSRFQIVVTLKPNKRSADALKLVDGELARLAAAPAAELEAELVRAKRTTSASFWFGLERVSGTAEMGNSYNDSAGTPNFFAQDYARYVQASGASVAAAVRTYLPLNRRVVAHVAPTVGAPLAGVLTDRHNEGGIR
jgi:zinc protease